MDVLLNMANSLSNDDSLKSYLLQVINNLSGADPLGSGKIKLGKSLSVPIDTKDICNGYSITYSLFPIPYPPQASPPT